MTSFPLPRSGEPAPRRRFNIEKWGWIYMRGSGVVLVVLIFGHLFVNLFAGDGVQAIDWAFVAGKWANPFWIVWDLLLLWLALIHGANGMRTIINDYATPGLRRVFLILLAAATIVLLILGTLVLTTFDPCLDPDTAATLGTVCK
ncbi:succinate dehydrogenase hydrophobic membrane anchor subunit [Galbitalea sp. SE-J8]|uniref:succinate dehydrogenase hydrophobic membrane anchor subunit n=1 Tax=Galbitalea sp. SE-J8 TaxID=3054952 RepID=UPI00259D1C6F|nr:succinate dehydrogenase hydrophobic membrane anchor subunit [Galbitalea sp. SE-J8]MDM4763642.1 succinate dehydrogenase hydrophobic membrane anchor subunit [Galbitalea sp. SE-J8]